MLGVVKWLSSRIAVIYVLLFLFCLACIDFKALDLRVKTRHLNDAIPDFSDMIIFSKDQNAMKAMDWKPYKDYFELILSYIPSDLVTKQLLGYVDYYAGQEEKAISLFKDSTAMDGHDLFLSNYNLGVIYYKKGSWPLAAQYLLKAVMASPQLTQILMQNSIIYKQIFISPFFKYSISDESNEAQAQAYILLLSSLNNMRQYDKMVFMSNVALANNKLSYKDAYYYYAGLGFYEEGQFEKAYVLFQKSTTLEKNNPDTYYYMANIYQNAGHQEEARDLYQLSYALHQKNDPRFPYDAHVYLRFF